MVWSTITDWLRMRRLGKLGIVGIVALICAGVSAHAAIRAIVEQQARATGVASPRPAGYEAEDHFPGAAYFYAAEESAAPGAGATGTTALPDLPVPVEAAALTTTDASIRPAEPFSMSKASPTDRGRALECLTAAIYYEAATEPDDGQQAVAQVILNRVRHPAFPATICGVVYQGSERTTGCQFSYACDGSMARVPSRTYWVRAMKVAAAALNGHVFAPVGLATHYHTYAVTPSWNRSLVMTAAIGAHFFHRWQGWWGTPAAFSQRYTGNEPLPGPHARPATPDLTLASATTSIPAPAPRTAPALIQPAYAQSGMLKPAVAAPDTTGESQILDRWKDSGKPLR